MNNMPARIKVLCAGILLGSVMFGAVRADTIVQFNVANVQANGVFGPINNYQVQLYNNQTPITVNNFLQYVNNHSYDNSMIHRNGKTQSGLPFVVQGGGYIPAFDGTDTLTGVYSITPYAPIQNESQLSNVRGTIAMARTSDPNSATSQWFVNATDNLALDPSLNNPGYAVFGRVVGEGMKLVDAVTSIQNYNAGGAFTELPLINYNTSLPLKKSNFVIVTSASVVPTVQWQGGSSSGATNWALAANWSSGSAGPNGAGINLVVGSQPSANNVIDIMSGGGRTVGNIYFSAATSTTIKSTGGYSLTLDNGSNATTVSVLGNQTISAPVILNSNTIFSGDGTLTLSGGVSSSHSMDVLSGTITAKSICVNTLNIGIGSMSTSQMISGGASGNATTPVPEPSVLVLLGIGISGLLAYGWRRRKRAT
jgi:peptidyl-prolyl cis-trans isomerase A (cyclophilin A)